MRARTTFTGVAVLLLLLPVATFSAIILPFHGVSATPTSASGYPRGLQLSSGYANVSYVLPAAISRSRTLGTLSPTTALSLGILLPPRDQQGLTQFLSALYDPSSPQFHSYLTPNEYSRQFGPSGSEATLLISYLTSQGIRAAVDPFNPFLIRATGSAKDVEKAFKVDLKNYESIGGASFYSPISLPQLPVQLSNVQLMYGLDNYGSLKTNSQPPALPLYRTLGELPNGISAINSIYYSPSEIKQIYNVTALSNSGYDGSGISIGIVDAYGDPYIQQELNNFSSEFGLPPSTVNVVCVDGPCSYSQGISQGWNTEIALDVEWAHALAPGAHINLYVASNSSAPLYDAVEQAVASGANSIISMSWGSPENTIGESSSINPIVGQSYPWLNSVFQQAAAEGITAFSSTGDWGAYDQSLNQSSPYGGAVYPSTDPFVTGVGGTSLYMGTTSGYSSYPYFNASGTFGSETGWSWNNVLKGATGGGYSTIFPKPAWQKGPGVSSSSGMRGAPDVAWDADPQTGVVVSIYDQASGSFAYYVVGGTSVGSPSWSGALALIEQKVGGRLGLINPALYSILNNKTEYTAAFHDVTQGNNNPMSANPGWDPLTGVGTPNVGELSRLLGRSTGAISVAVTNDLSGQFAKSYSYGSQVNLSAKVSGVPSGATLTGVSANITSPSGSLIATNVPMGYDSTTDSYTGSYTIKAQDLPGEWSATVLARTGSLQGLGYTYFSVGGGITLLEPFFNPNNFTFNSHDFQLGGKIAVTAQVTSPSGVCCVSSGYYAADFHLNVPSGKVVGSVPLVYNQSSRTWGGTFTIPKSADQGNWILDINGSDSQGNRAETYQWLYVGLNTVVTTDSPSYVLGNQIDIIATSSLVSGHEIKQGSFTAEITAGSRVLTSIPLAFDPLIGAWAGAYNTHTGDPAGYYNITVGGSDNSGNYGVSNTIVHVAQFNLALNASLASSEISVVNGSEAWVSARVAYPNGTVMTSGSVVADVSLDFGGVAQLPLGEVRMSYQSATQSYVGLDVLTSRNVVDQSLGKYDVVVQAFDGSGNYGNFTSHFYVLGIKHSPITISNDANFTKDNGVYNGSGISAAPYLIAGWNTSSISISGGQIFSSYELLNNWVSGSSGNGITIDTPHSDSPSLSFDFATSNALSGVSVVDTPSVQMGLVASIGNGQNGIVVENDPQAARGIMASVVSVSNRGTGILVENSPNANVQYSFAVSNGNSGILVENSFNSTVVLNYAAQNQIGIAVNGTSAYGEALIGGNALVQNSIGIAVDGMNQPLSTTNNFSSYAFVLLNQEANNSLALFASNRAVVRAENNTVGYGVDGFLYENSLPIVVGNVVAQNSGTAINVTGMASSLQECRVLLGNQTGAPTLLYSSCIAQNLIDGNGNSTKGSGAGIAISNVNGSFVYLNNVTNNLGNGMILSNVTNSGIYSNLALNDSESGVSLANSVGDNISFNAIGNGKNGILMSGGKGNSLVENNVSSNQLEGISLTGTKDNLLENNSLMSNGLDCSSPSCQFSGAIGLQSSSGNNITLNSIGNSKSQSSTTVGILLGSGSTGNTVTRNTVFNVDAGLGFVRSSHNTAGGNSFSDNTYGIYFLEGASNIYSGNTFSSNGQDYFPNQPKVQITSPGSNDTLYGVVLVRWNETGQAISNTTLSLDGYIVSVSGSSYDWNTTSLPDGPHNLTLTVSNSGGFNSTSKVVFMTDNIALFNHAISVEVVTPNGDPIPNSSVKITEGNLSLSSNTNLAGFATFHRLRVGTYQASAIINGTALNSTVQLTGNASVVLTPNALVTTAYVRNSNGSFLPILVSGNVTGSQLSNASISLSGGVYSLEFHIDGRQGTVGNFTLSIPKGSSSIPPGYLPQVIVNGTKLPSNEFSFSQDSSNYYIALSTRLGSTNIVIQFSKPSNAGAALMKYLVPIIVVVALLLAVLGFIFVRKGRKRTGMADSSAPDSPGGDQKAFNSFSERCRALR